MFIHAFRPIFKAILHEFTINIFEYLVVLEVYVKRYYWDFHKLITPITSGGSTFLPVLPVHDA